MYKEKEGKCWAKRLWESFGPKLFEELADSNHVSISLANGEDWIQLLWTFSEIVDETSKYINVYAKYIHIL